MKEPREGDVTLVSLLEDDEEKAMVAEGAWVLEKWWVSDVVRDTVDATGRRSLKLCNSLCKGSDQIRMLKEVPKATAARLRGWVWTVHKAVRRWREEGWRRGRRGGAAAAEVRRSGRRRDGGSG